MKQSKLYKERVLFFNKIVNCFNHKKISELVVAHKIEINLFKEIQKSATKYFDVSQKYSLQNMTPNGRLSPKKENQKAFNNFSIVYLKLLDSLKIIPALKNYLPPVIRYKEKKINKLNKNNNKRSELPHADCWAGWTGDFLLFLMPLLGDCTNNKIRFFNVPKNISTEWLKKKNFDEANKKLTNKLFPLKDHYKLGYVYVADITVPHVTVRNKKSGSRLSIDSPLQFKIGKNNNRKKRNNITAYISSKDNFISIAKAKKLNKEYYLYCPYKMGEFERTQGKKAKPAYKLLKKISC